MKNNLIITTTLINSYLLVRDINNHTILKEEFPFNKIWEILKFDHRLEICKNKYLWIISILIITLIKIFSFPSW